MAISRTDGKKDRISNQTDSATSGLPDWQARDAAIIEQAQLHPSTVEQLTKGRFSSRQAGYRRIAKLRKTKQLRHIGTVMLNGICRPQDMYCNGWKPKSSNLRHEKLLTDVLLAMGEIEIRRGYDVDSDVEPDAELRIGKRHFYIEMDTGTMSQWHLKRKWAKRYARVIQRVREGAPEFLLVVCVTERRLKGLVERSEPVKDIALYSTVERVMSDPWGKCWLDGNGKEGSLRNY